MQGINVTWEKEVKEIKHKRHLAEEMGGKDSVALQHSKGRLTIRERIHGILDENSFDEVGMHSYTNFLKYPEKYNWSTKNIGSFLIKLFIWQFSLFTKPKPCANIIENKFKLYQATIVN